MPGLDHIARCRIPRREANGIALRFDDRLATLLTLPVAGVRARAVRWRQLVELAARISESGTEDSAPMIAALAVIRSERAHIDIEVRSAVARAIAGRALGRDILMLFAEEELRVAAPVFAAARIDRAARTALVAASGGPTRNFLCDLWEDLEAPTAPASPVIDPSKTDEVADPIAPDSILESRRLGDVVERLKAARRAVAEAEAEAEAEVEGETGVEAEVEEELSSVPRSVPASLDGAPVTFQSGPAFSDLPSDRNAVSMFRWESGSDGAIAWVDGAPRAALVGQSLVKDRALAPVIGAREPFTGIVSSFTGMPGQWHLTGQPEYDPETGHFLGYRGAALRQGPEGETPTAATAPDFGIPLDPAALRELVHEIKTPLNAIIGFAEIIDGQYLGPAHRRYRERAAEIVTQARILLEAIKDLDFAARLHGGREDGAPAPLAQIIERLLPTLEAHAARRGVILTPTTSPGGEGCATNADLSSRLVERLVNALVDTSENTERLALETLGEAGHCALRISRPSSLRDYTIQQLFDPALLLEREGHALLGIGFSLRLVRGLARVGGGDLTVDADHFRLTLVRAA